MYHPPPSSDIADSGTIEPNVEGILPDSKIVGDDQANQELDPIGFEGASQSYLQSFR